MCICLPAPFYVQSINFPTVKMGVAQKAMFSISDRLAKFFGISGASMEHNAIAKSKKTFFLQIRHKRPRTILSKKYLPLQEVCSLQIFPFSRMRYITETFALN